MTLKAAIDGVQRDPEQSEAWATLARELKRADRLPEARESLERAIYLEPTRESLYEELFSLEQSQELPVWVGDLARELEQGDGVTLAPRPGRIVPRRFVLLPIVLTILTALLGTGLGLWIGSTASADAPRPRTDTPALIVDGRGQTRADAIAPGEEIQVGDGLGVTLVGVVEDASDFEIRYYYDYDGDGEKEFEYEVPSGLRPYIVRLVAHNVGSEEELYVGSLDLSLSTDDLASFDTDCGIVPEELGGVGPSTLQPGQRAEGNVCVLVDREATPTYLGVEGPLGRDRRFFRLPTSDG